jgi:hypothetical protein
VHNQDSFLKTPKSDTVACTCQLVWLH